MGGFDCLGLLPAEVPGVETPGYADVLSALDDGAAIGEDGELVAGIWLKTQGELVAADIAEA